MYNVQNKLRASLRINIRNKRQRVWVVRIVRSIKPKLSQRMKKEVDWREPISRKIAKYNGFVEVQTTKLHN